MASPQDRTNDRIHELRGKCRLLYTSANKQMPSGLMLTGIEPWLDAACWKGVGALYAQVFEKHGFARMEQLQGIDDRVYDRLLDVLQATAGAKEGHLDYLRKAVDSARKTSVEAKVRVLAAAVGVGFVEPLDETLDAVEEALIKKMEESQLETAEEVQDRKTPEPLAHEAAGLRAKLASMDPYEKLELLAEGKRQGLLLFSGARFAIMLRWVAARHDVRVDFVCERFVAVGDELKCSVAAVAALAGGESVTLTGVPLPSNARDIMDDVARENPGQTVIWDASGETVIWDASGVSGISKMGGTWWAPAMKREKLDDMGRKGAEITGGAVEGLSPSERPEVVSNSPFDREVSEPLDPLLRRANTFKDEFGHLWQRLGRKADEEKKPQCLPGPCLGYQCLFADVLIKEIVVLFLQKNYLDAYKLIQNLLETCAWLKHGLDHEAAFRLSHLASLRNECRALLKIEYRQNEAKAATEREAKRAANERELLADDDREKAAKASKKSKNRKKKPRAAKRAQPAADETAPAADAEPPAPAAEEAAPAPAAEPPVDAEPPAPAAEATEPPAPAAEQPAEEAAPAPAAEPIAPAADSEPPAPAADAEPPAPAAEEAAPAPAAEQPAAEEPPAPAPAADVEEAAPAPAADAESPVPAADAPAAEEEPAPAPAPAEVARDAPAPEPQEDETSTATAQSGPADEDQRPFTPVCHKRHQKRTEEHEARGKSPGARKASGRGLSCNKTAAPAAGLENHLGRICWMNAMLQAVTHGSPVPQLLRDASPTPKAIVSRGLKTLAELLLTSTEVISAEQFQKRLGEPWCGPNEEDAGGFLHYLFHQVLREEDNGVSSTALDAVLKGETVIKRKCLACKHEFDSETEEFDGCLPLHVPASGGEVALEELMHLYHGAGKYKCPECHKKAARNSITELYRAPRRLMISLEFFGGNSEGTTTKVTTIVDYPVDLVLDGNEYKLDAVVFHRGFDKTGGHFYACCRNSSDDNWRRFDDTKVTNCDAPGTHDAENSPYVLFYELVKAAPASDSLTTPPNHVVTPDKKQSYLEAALPT